ncbi:MAG TPA: glycosyl hydrolase 108 family protein [Puia sp.]|nr:glycosyl hydrolase 108 family protein [Puia sp.]
MADFKLFWPLLSENEGYYANDPADSGGETWRGISRNNYPGWSGWAIIDSYKKGSAFAGAHEANTLLKPDATLEAKVIAFYKSSQWDVIQADAMQNQSIANFLADWGVNAGMSVPIKHVQRILGLDVDGKVGPHTLAALNSASGPDLFKKLQADREQFYMDVVTVHPDNRKFLTTWLKRNASFSYQA